MPNIESRAVIGDGLIIIKTPKAYTVRDLKDWNRNGYNSAVLFKCHTTDELRAYETWLKEIMAGGVPA